MSSKICEFAQSLPITACYPELQPKNSDNEQVCTMDPTFVIVCDHGGDNSDCPLYQKQSRKQQNPE
jgi:hypothetical protein